MDALDITEVSFGLWVGADPEHELTNTINSVVNLRCEFPHKYHEQLTNLLWMPTADGQYLGICWLETILAYIKNMHEMGHAVLVHCLAGVSRSPFVAAAYLMQQNMYGFDRALDTIGKKNDHASIPRPHI